MAKCHFFKSKICNIQILSVQIFIHHLPVQLVVGSEVGISYVTDKKSSVSYRMTASEIR